MTVVLRPAPRAEVYSLMLRVFYLLQHNKRIIDRHDKRIMVQHNKRTLDTHDKREEPPWRLLPKNWLMHYKPFTNFRQMAQLPYALPISRVLTVNASFKMASLRKLSRAGMYQLASMKHAVKARLGMRPFGNFVQLTLIT